MPKKPPTTVKSVRMADDLWAFVSARAKERNVSPNAWLGLCVDAARKRLANGKAAD